MPSPRKPGTSAFKRHETLNPQVKTMLRVGRRQFAVHIVDVDNDEEFPAVLVAVTDALRKMDLTAMTTVEIEALRKFWNDACDDAVIITKVLDQRAADEMALGHTNYKRLWRPDPVRIDMDVNRDPNPRTKEDPTCSPSTASTPLPTTSP